MKMIQWVPLLFGIILVGPVQAAEKTLTPQESLKGDDRSKFMSGCLKKQV